MKATIDGLKLAESARDALRRVNKAIGDATKRLAELSNEPEKSMRVTAAIEQIQAAMKRADAVRGVVTALALASISVQGANFELGDAELLALSYGIESK